MKKSWLGITIIGSLLLVPSLGLAKVVVAKKAPVKKAIVRPLVKTSVKVGTDEQVMYNKAEGFALKVPKGWTMYDNAGIEGDEKTKVGLILGDAGNVHAAVISNYSLEQLPSVSQVVVTVKGGVAEYYPWSVKLMPDPYPTGVTPVSKTIIASAKTSAVIRWIGKGIPNDPEGSWVAYESILGTTSYRVFTSNYQAVRIIALVPSGRDHDAQIKQLDDMAKGVRFSLNTKIQDQALPDAPMVAPADPTQLP